MVPVVIPTTPPPGGRLPGADTAAGEPLTGRPSGSDNYHPAAPVYYDYTTPSLTRTTVSM